MTKKLSRDVTVVGFPDPFSPKTRTNVLNTILATAIFRCWHIILFFGGWATFVTIWNQHHLTRDKKKQLIIQATLLTVIGSVLGFVISYRTTSSFERYNEGRRLWAQILLGCRGFARTAWFHVPATMPGANPNDEQHKARILIEKKTTINLLEAYAVAVKHYLRGEDGIYYQDLFHLVKFLPAYALPPGLPSKADIRQAGTNIMASEDGTVNTNNADAQLPMPASAGVQSERNGPSSPLSPRFAHAEKIMDTTSGEEMWLYPARNPPSFSVFDVFPFSLLGRALTRKGRSVGGSKAARRRAKQGNVMSHNIPLEISLYLSSYIAALQARKAIDAPTTTNLLAQLNTLVDALTGLERILTTPIPFSYSFHLWAVTFVYCISLPPQIWSTMRMWTIPFTIFAAFIFFGFLVAGEEIENPFGYDKNDLNMDHFTHNIIRQELRAITGLSAPDPTRWVFNPDNDFVLAAHVEDEERVSPEEWVRRGPTEVQSALAAQSYAEGMRFR